MCTIYINLDLDDELDLSLESYTNFDEDDLDLSLESDMDFDDFVIVTESSQSILKTYHAASEEIVTLSYKLNKNIPFKEHKEILKRMIEIANRCIDNIRKDKLSEDESEEIIKLKAVDQIADAMLASIKRTLSYSEISSYKIASIENTVNMRTLQVSKKALIECLEKAIEAFEEWIDSVNKYYSSKNTLATKEYKDSFFGRGVKK